MYKVNYYTLAVCKNGNVGNVKQFYNTWYTETSIPDIENGLQRIVDTIYGYNKYMPVITKIEKIAGHCDVGVEEQE